MAISKEKRRAQLREAAARYRARHPEEKRNSDKKFRDKTQTARPIIAIDCEGVDVSEDRHELVLVGASTGVMRHSPNGDGFRTEDILDKFFLPLLLDNRGAIFVSFGFDYDARMIFRDVSALQWEAIKLKSKPVRVMDGKYRVTWTKNQLSITFLKVAGRPCITIYDMIDFFGGTFVSAIEKYIAPGFDENAQQDFEKVIEGKKVRGSLTLDEFDYIVDYWWAEIQFMPVLIETLRDSVEKYLDIVVTKWNTATQLTTELLNRHKVSDVMQAAPDWVPVDRAFFGARIEAFYVGRVGQDVWDYDLNGAYGYGLKWLPNLKTGTWVEIPGEEFSWLTDYVPFGIYELEYEHWDVSTVLPQPLPVRRGKALLFPASADTFVWGPEAWLVRNEVRVVRAWVYQDDGSRPLSDLADQLWNTRATMRRDGDPAEKVVKQALARVVGKFCQSFGTETNYFTGQIEREPRYRRLEYAGFLTSFTRARLFEAMQIVVQSGGIIYNCNTDGFTTNIDVGQRLDFIHGFGDDLGQWKAQKYEDLIIVETNMYMLKNTPWAEKQQGKDWVVKKAGYGPGYSITYDEIIEELSRDDIWDREAPMVFRGKRFDAEAMVWGWEYTSRYLGGKGKRIHTRNCGACAEGLRPSDAPHTLTPRL